MRLYRFLILFIIATISVSIPWVALCVIYEDEDVNRYDDPEGGYIQVSAYVMLDTDIVCTYHVSSRDYDGVYWQPDGPMTCVFGATVSGESIVVFAGDVDSDYYDDDYYAEPGKVITEADSSTHSYFERWDDFSLDLYAQAIVQWDP